MYFCKDCSLDVRECWNCVCVRVRLGFRVASAHACVFGEAAPVACRRSLVNASRSVKRDGRVESLRIKTFYRKLHSAYFLPHTCSHITKRIILQSSTHQLTFRTYSKIFSNARVGKHYFNYITTFYFFE